MGCGHYEECGAGDDGGIARLMNEYAFGACFNPGIHEDIYLQFIMILPVRKQIRAVLLY